MKAATQTSTVFDQDHYLRLIEARGDTIRRVVTQLKPALNLSTALDAGCGLGFFAQILQECELNVHAFDGRESNVTEGRRRFPKIHFEQADIQDPNILSLGKFDLVLCFGLLYHLESPLLAIRHLRALSGNALLLESMCLPDVQPWMLLREELSLEDQSLTDIAFYATEGCLVKMLYRSGFAFVYRLAQLPHHDDFRDTQDHRRRRTVLLATPAPLEMEGFELFGEPVEALDPWFKQSPNPPALHDRLRSFMRKPARDKYNALTRRIKRLFPSLPTPVKLSFGAWWIAESSALDQELLSNSFEMAEVQFVRRFLRPGMTVLDIGAHHGFYSLLASLSVGAEGRVFAFEPSPRERKRLRRHLSINKCTNVEPVEVALGATSGTATLFLVKGSQDYCNSLRPPAVEAQTAAVSVDVISLDQFLASREVSRVDFVKIDVEGAELDTLKGASLLLTMQPRPILMVEVYDIRTKPWGYAAREIVQLLERTSYRCCQLRRDGTVEPTDPNKDSYDTNIIAVPSERTSEFL